MRALALVLLLSACGARTGLDEPPACDVAEDCPPEEDFCARTVLCLRDRCALGDPPSCDDSSECTDDRCDRDARACVHAIRDRDGDGAGDGSCGGDDCDDHDPTIRPGAVDLCRGGRDEDCDARTDCSDDDCRDDPSCAGCDPEACESGVDEDCDGAVDCDDSDCAASCCDASELDCDDGRDGDCDGAIDCLDPDCAHAPTCCVPAPEICDGADDDCDGVPDDGATCFTLDGAPIAAIETSSCGDAWYSYGVPDDSSAAPTPDIRVSSRVTVVIVDSPPSCGGAGVAVIADRTRDGSGGSLRGAFEVEPRGLGALVVGDEPNECTFDPAAGVGSCSWRWQPCCTDGVLIGRLGTDFCVDVTISSPDGVSRLVVLDGATEVTQSFGAPFELCGRTLPAVP